MSLADYVELTDMNVEMTEYVCGTDDEAIDTAWNNIKVNYGL